MGSLHVPATSSCDRYKQVMLRAWAPLGPLRPDTYREMSDTSTLGEVLKMAEDAVSQAQQASGPAPDANVGMGAGTPQPVAVVVQPVTVTTPSTVTQLTPPTLDAPDPTEVKPTWYWIKDARGYGSVTTTLMFISFWITTIAYVLSMFDRIGPFSIRPFDVAACSSYFIPLLTLYFGRKATEAWSNKGS